MVWAAHGLQRPGPMPGIVASAALGLFWGGWAVAWGTETPPIVASAARVRRPRPRRHAASGHCPMDHRPVRPRHLSSKPGPLALASLPFAVFFILVTVPTVPIAPLVLLPLLALTSLALVRSARLKNSCCLLDVMAAPVPWLNWICLLAMPATATIVYASCNAAGLIPPTHQIVCFSTTGAGFAILWVGSFSVVQTPGRPAQGHRGRAKDAVKVCHGLEVQRSSVKAASGICASLNPRAIPSYTVPPPAIGPTAVFRGSTTSTSRFS